MRIDEAKDFFFDPISGQRMQKPYQNSCGHTYEQSQIQGWMGRAVKKGEVPNCPLCRASVNNLILNRLIKKTLDILYAPDNAHIETIEELTDEERETVENTIEIVKKQREEDCTKSIPNKLEQTETFVSKIVEASKEFYCQ